MKKLAVLLAILVMVVLVGCENKDYKWSKVNWSDTKLLIPVTKMKSKEYSTNIALNWDNKDGWNLTEQWDK